MKHKHCSMQGFNELRKSINNPPYRAVYIDKHGELLVASINTWYFTGTMYGVFLTEFFVDI